MRRLPSWFVVAAATSVGAIAAVACTTTDSGPAPLSVSDRPPGTPHDGGASSGSIEDVYEPPLEGGTTAGRVYAHTMDTLYVFEPVSKRLTTIGQFDCRGADPVIDLAIDRSGAMYATTYHAFLSVDPTSAKCTVVHAFTDGTYYPNSLSFVPIGTVEPTTEALVGYQQNGSYIDQYVEIDTTTGAITPRGSLNPAGGVGGTYYDVAGDLIALIRDDRRAYAIVTPDTVPDGGTVTDYLAEIDPKNGQILKVVGPTNQVQTYGFGYWAGTGYGFSADGRLTAIDMTTGKATDVIVMDAGGAWYGAGVTTDAPVR